MPETVLVVIQGDAKQYFKEMGRAGQATDKFAGRTKKAGMGLRQLRSTLFMVTAAIGGMVLGIKKLIDAYANQEKEERLLRTALRNRLETEEEVNVTTERMIQLAKERQKVTPFGDEESIAALKIAGTFPLAAEQMEQLLIRAQDFSAATGKDLVSAMADLGRATEGQFGMLSRYGVSISEETKRTGDFNLLLRDLDNNFRGMAETMGQTVEGRLKMFGNLIGDAKERVGAALVPALQALMPSLMKFVDIIDMLAPFLKTIVEIAGKLLERLLPLVERILGAILPVLEKLLQPMSEILFSLVDNILTPLVGLIEALMPLIESLVPILELIAKILDPILKILGLAIDGISKLIKGLWKVSDVMKEHVNKQFRELKTVVEDTQTAFANWFDEARENSPVMEGLYNIFVNMHNILKKIWENIIKPALVWYAKLHGVKTRTETIAESDAALSALMSGVIAAGDVAKGMEKGKTTEAPPSVTGEGGVTEATKKRAASMIEYLGLLSKQLGYLRENWNLSWVAMGDVIDLGVARMEDSLEELEEKFEETINQLRDTIIGLGHTIDDVLGAGFRAVMDDMLGKLKVSFKEGTTLAGKFFGSIWNALLNLIKKIVTSALLQLAVQLVATLAGVPTPGGFTGLSFLFKAIGIPVGRQFGGPTRKRFPYLVGEHGPELFVPQGAGEVLSGTRMNEFLNRMTNALTARPAMAPAGALGANIVIEEREHGLFNALFKAYERLPNQQRRQFARKVYDAQDYEDKV